MRYTLIITYLLYTLFAYSCSFSTNKTNVITGALVIDTIYTDTDFNAIIKSANLKSSMEYVRYRENLYIAYIDRKTNDFILKGIMNTDTTYKVPLPKSINTKFQENKSFSFGFDNGNFFFFPYETYYYTLSIDSVLNNQIHFQKDTFPEFSFFDNNQFLVKSNESRLALRNGQVIFSYKKELSEYKNQLDSTACLLIKDFRSQEHRKSQLICPHNNYLLHNSEHLVTPLGDLSADGSIFYFTNKKSDSITFYNIQNGQTVNYPIGGSKHTVFDSTKYGDIDYLMSYAFDNDINFKILPNADGCFLIKRLKNDQQQKVYEIIHYNNSGEPDKKQTLTNNHLNITLSFLANEKIYIPVSGTNYLLCLSY